MTAGRASHFLRSATLRGLLGEGRTRLLRLGLLMEAIYLLFFTARFPLPRLYSTLPPVDFAKATYFFWADSVAFVVLVTALFVAWALAARAARLLPPSPRVLTLILAGGLLFGLTLVPLYPVQATDVFSYAVYGRVAALHHENPFAVAPAAFPTDPWLGLMGEWNQVASAYGPLWEGLNFVAARLAGENFLLQLFLLKLIALAFYALSVAVVWAILGRLAPEQRTAGTLLVAWNPLVLLETAGNGHNDIVMVACILLAVYFLVSRRDGAVVPALVVATLVKHIAILLVPPFLLYLAWKRAPARRWLFLAWNAALALVLLVAVWLPVWPGWEHWAGREVANGAAFSVAALLILLLKRVMQTGGAYRVGQFVVFTLFALTYLWSIRRRPTDARQAIRAGLVVLTGYLVFGAMQFHTWYLVWVLPLAAILGAGEMIPIGVLAWSSLMGYAVYSMLWPWFYDALGPMGIHLIGVPLTFLPPLAGVMWVRRRGKMAVR